MDMRQLKGLEIAARMRLAWDGDAWTVPSQTGSGKYRVRLHPFESCTCDDFGLTAKACKHIYAARFAQERDHGGQAPVIDTDTLPKRPTYAQDWPAYNLAQTTGKHRLQVLLAELCRGVPELPYKGGRRRVPVADALFACAFKVYGTFSARRFTCDLLDARKRGHVSRALHYNKVLAYLENPDLAPILTDLVVQSSLPLKSVETELAPDSSGFSVSRFVRWVDEKHGTARGGRDWVKVHLMCGVKTNIVTAAVILDRNAADSPQLPGLLETTAKNFTVKEVPADKGYSSVDNVEAVAKLGAFPFIAFKSNTTGAAGGSWEKLFYFYNFHREEFLRHYHKRSNVESTFSMIKAKFGDNVRCRTDAAMRNEVLCKILCHNLCCLVLSQHELGIEPVSWSDDAPPTEEMRVLRFPG